MFSPAHAPKINASGETAQLSSTATGSVISHMTINHPSAQSPKEVLVLNADTQEELDSMKAFYSDKTYYSVNVESKVSIYASQVGFTDGNGEALDFSTVASQVTWTSSNPLIASVERHADSPLIGVVTGNKAGTAKITLSYKETSATFTVTVYPKGVEIGEVEKTIYLTTSQNVIILSAPNEMATATVTAIGLDSSQYSKISWEVMDRSVCKVIPNETSASITAVAEGETEIQVSHPDSENTIKIHVRVGSEYIEVEDSAVPYISTVNLMTILTSDSAKKLTAQLANYSGTDTRGFSFASSDEGIAVISAQSANGTAYVKGLATGYTEITVSHTLTDVTKKVLVVVGETEAEIEEILSKKIYFTTKKNVFTFSTIGENATASLSVLNLADSEYSNISWTTSDESVASVVPNGISATITANGNGKAIVYASYPKSINTMSFYVFVGTEAAQSSAGTSTGNGQTVTSVVTISAVNVLTVLTDGEKQLTAKLDNYSGSDNQGFSFGISDTGIAKITSQSSNGTAYVRGLTSGYTEITVSHTLTDVTKKVLVVVGRTEAEIAEILSKSIYFTTTKNAFFVTAGDRQSVQITANNMSADESQEITWATADKKIADVIGNGTSATIRALSEGSTTLTVSHSKSLNSLTLYIYVETASSAGSSASPSASKVVLIAAQDDLSLVSGGQAVAVQAVLVNYSGSDTNGFSFEVDKEGVVSIIAQYATGTCYVKPNSAGQAEITITHPKAAYPKKVLVNVGNTPDELSTVKYLSTATNVVNISEGATKSVTVTFENATETIIGGYTWKSADPTVASVLQTTSGTALISGNKVGTTRIIVTHEKSDYPVEIIIQVIDPIAATASPFIQVPNPILTLVESTSWTTLTAELVGGSDDDESSFIWTVYDGTGVIELYSQNGIAKVRAKKAGIAVVRVSHPKAAYPQDIRLICDAATSTEYSISVSSGNIMSIRPDGGDETITATLVNGSTTDKYNFKWSLDVYDIIDMTYSANTAIITPLKEGTAVITVSHPKSAYDQQIAVKVQQYSTFGFSVVSKTVTVGQSTFITMQVPASSVETSVSYYSDNEKIAKISGTSAVCQITGYSAETVTVHAQLIAKKTGVVQAEDDMLVIVQPAAANLVYINGTAGLTSTFSMTLGTSRVMTAEIIGDDITIADQTSLVWSVPTNQNVLTLASMDSTGSVSGSSAYITAANAGETTLTVTHPKTTYTLVYHIIVPGAEAVEVTLDKTFVSIEKGKSTTVKATVSSGKAADYKALEWSISRVDDAEIATVNGSGQSVTIYGTKAGTVYLTCEYPGSGSSAKCQVTVNDPKTLSLDRQVLKVEPNATKKFSYKVTPADATISWVYASAIDGSELFSFIPSTPNSAGEGTVEVTGIKEGTSLLSAVSSYGNKANIQIQVGWDYSFSLSGDTETTIKPSQTIELTYSVNPANAKISVSSTDLDKLFTCDIKSENEIENENEIGKGTIIITPLTETKDTVSITFTATNPAEGVSNATIGTQTVKAKFYYSDDEITLVPTIISGNKNGFASATKDAIVIADGQRVDVKFTVSNANADVKVKKVEFSDSDSEYQDITVLDTANDDTHTLMCDETLTEYQYRIVTGYSPVYKKTEDITVVTTYDDDYGMESELVVDQLSTQSTFYLSPTDFEWKAMYFGNEKSYGLLSITHSYIPPATLFSSAKCQGAILDGHCDWVYFCQDTAHSSGLPQRTTVSNADEWYTDDSYSRKRDASLDGKIYTVSQFESIPWYYCPGITDFGSSQKINVAPHVMTNNIDAVKEPTTTNTKVKQRKSVGYIMITWSHMGQDKTTKIPAYIDERYCLGTYGQ